MDTVDSVQNLTAVSNAREQRSKIPFLILILLFVFVLVSFILVIYIVVELKNIEEKDENKENQQEQEQEQTPSGKTGQAPYIGLTGKREPVIVGETGNMTEDANTPDQVQVHYIEAIERVGGIPISLPVLQKFDMETIKKQIELVDALVIQGGLDVDPSFYHTTPDPKLGTTNIKTDEYLLEAIRQARARKIPILGICRGLQILNVAFGGTLYQDLETNLGEKYLIHHQRADQLCEPAHNITIVSNSLMAKMFPGKTKMEVNSWHHQAIKNLGADLEVDARADDEIIEAINYKGTDEWIFGVQFHPEQFMRCGNDVFKPIFEELIKQAKLKRDGQ